MNNETNTDVAYKNFMKIFFSAYETTIPEIEKKKKKKKENKTISKSVVNRRDQKNLKKEKKSSSKVFTVNKKSKRGNIQNIQRLS